MTYTPRAQRLNSGATVARHAFAIPSKSVMHGEKPAAKHSISPNSYMHITGRNQGINDAARLSALRLSSI